MTLRLLCATLLALVATSGAAQTEGLLQIEGDLERFVLRQHALGRLPTLDTGALPLATRTALALLDSLDADGLSSVDRALLASYRGGEAGGLLGPFVARATPLYPDNRSAGRVTGDGYGLEAGPLVNASGGPAYINRVGDETDEGTAWVFSRGVRFAGHAGRLFAETRILENQILSPNGESPFRTAPRIAYSKTTGSPDPTYDFLSTTGIVGYRDRFVELRAGRDRNRWGFARGATLLSDYASEYDHVQARLDVGPLSVQALYARFLDPRARGRSDGDGVVDQRYGVFHRATVRLGRGVELEAFETVIFGDRDSDNRNGFEPAYLVPFGLYRAVERDLGSPDNVLLGGGGAWTIRPGVRLYAQAMIDELTARRFSEDAWTNKWAFVLGAQVSDPTVPLLGQIRDTDLRLEYARVRPYTYSHRDSVTAAVHYGDVLGHPAGPNASDLSVWLAHRPHPDVEVSLDAAYTVRGRNTDALNYGGDPQRPYTDRAPEPNPTLQGVRQRRGVLDLRASARVLPDAHVGVSLQARLLDDAESGGSGFVAPQAFLRWGLAPPSPRTGAVGF